MYDDQVFLIAFWAFFVIAVFTKVYIPPLLLFFVTYTDAGDGLESWVGPANITVALGKVKLKAYNSPDFGFPTLIFYAYEK